MTLLALYLTTLATTVIMLAHARLQPFDYPLDDYSDGFRRDR